MKDLHGNIMTSEEIGKLTEEEAIKLINNKVNELEGDKRTKLWKIKQSKHRETLKNEYRILRNDYLLNKFCNSCSETISDIASIKLMKEENTYVLLSIGSDGEGYYAIYNDYEEVPGSFISQSISLNGKYKIMTYDCSKSYEEEGVIIEGYIKLFRDGNRWIFIINN